MQDAMANIFGHTIKLGSLSDAEARELVAGSPKPFNPADVEWILVQSTWCKARFEKVYIGQTTNLIIGTITHGDTYAIFII